MLRLVPPWAFAAAGAVLLAITFAAGFKVASWRCESEKLEAVQRAIKRADEARAKVQDEATKYENERETARQQGIERETRIRTIYRDVEVPGACAAPDSVRSVLDEAVRAANGQPVAEPRG